MVTIEVRSMTENTCREGLHLIFRINVDIWTSKGHQGRSIYVSKISWVIDDLKLWLFENFSSNMIISPTHKQTEGRAPLWGSDFTIKVAPQGGGGSAEIYAGLK
jgi:hypothetical protein